MVNFDYKNYNYSLKKEDSTNFNQQKEKQINSQQADEEIRNCYNELGKYSAPSMENICSIWNNNFKAAGDTFYAEHMQYCDTYGDAAALYGKGIQNSSDIEPLLENIKTATKSAINGLKQLITKEKQFMTQNSIKEENEYQTEKAEKSDNENKEDNDKNMLDTFINTINNIFA